MPDDHKISITKFWLLGLVEGDGSFSCERRDGGLNFSVCLKKNLDLLVAIQGFLYNLLPSTNKELYKNAISLVSRPGVTWELIVRRSDFHGIVTIPLFNSVTFLIQKGLDYFDFLAIFNIKKKALHYLPEGQNLIERILNQMNNNRLSTFTSSVKHPSSIDRAKLIADIDSLLSMPNNYEYKEDGRVLIISEGTLLNDRQTKVLQLISQSGTVIETFHSSSDKCAEFLGISLSTFKRRLKDGQPFLYKDQQCTLKRVVEASND